MIKNERQYKLTRAQLAEFEKTIRDLEQQGYRESTDVLQRAELGALESQLSDLMQDISEYESLREAPPPVIEGANLDELPRALIRARIALGLSQKALADKMGLKEQQVQRYEATNYESASLSRLQEIARALGVHVSERISLPLVARSREALYSRLDTVGIDREFLLGRILPTDIAFGLEREEGAPDNVWIPQAHRILERVFGWTDNQLLAAEPLALPQEATATARFKIPAGAQGRRLGAYVAYAHYLAMVVASGVDHLPQIALETDPTRMRESLLTFGPTMSLKTVMNYFWDHGIAAKVSISTFGYFA